MNAISPPAHEAPTLRIPVLRVPQIRRALVSLHQTENAGNGATIPSPRARMQ